MSELSAQLRASVGKKIDEESNEFKELADLVWSDPDNNEASLRKITQKELKAALNAERLLAGRPRSYAETADLVLDNDDLEILESDRCALDAISEEVLPKQLYDNLPRRQVERGWQGRTILNVGFNTIFSAAGVTKQEAEVAVASAMQTWNAAQIGISFRPAAGNLDILITFRAPNQDPERYLSNSRFAHADYPPGNNWFRQPPMPMCFSSFHFWATDGRASAYDIETVALHEFGHAVGLFHRQQGTIMYSRLRKGQVARTLDAETVNAARRLYSSRPFV